MSILDWFANRERRTTASEKLNIPQNVWIKCTSCSEVLFLKDLQKNNQVCQKCEFHFRMTVVERIELLLDAESFSEINASLKPVDFLSFTDTESYQKRIQRAMAKSGRNDAVVTGTGTIDGNAVNLGVMDFGYMGGSMGSVVGEKITRLIELACKNRNPLIICTSSGGARMQESTISLMQMAKTAMGLARLAQLKVPYISVLCDPTTGGTSASFAMLGDVQIAEPGALISFAGPRVIEQTIRQKLPEGFQRSEFLLDHGTIDKVVHRRDLRATVSALVTLLDPRNR